ncbi:MAG TPA: PorP/SprF family type IX secretion system membrane protein [Bacteroidales bacterium]|jgi:type IX secretion system PorP/SprF family membrane protein|nr:PorP/SprF family type IX secretion system membrane protein [Bacteroidales bacterium]
MKQIIISIAFVLVSAVLAAQQMPLSENYYLDRYSLSPSYAGHFNPGNLVAGYRSDWSGIEGGPRTFRLSYSDLLMANAAYGGKLIYDRAGIYDQLYLMGTYSYNLRVSGEHRVLLALSAGIYNNKINFTDYYNDPKYNLDPVMIRDDVRSKMKFMSDFSAVYIFKDIEAGVMFANINFGDAKYEDVDVTYKPLANYQVHAAYLYRFDERWAVNPLAYIRGGKYIKNQVGISARVIYQDNLWASLSFRDPSILGFGLGGKIAKGLSFSYNFNMATAVELNVFNSHEIAIGITLDELFRPKASE